MKTFARLLAISALAVSLVGCADTVAKFENAYQAITASTVSPEAVTLAASAFDAVEVTATNYLRLKRCDGSNGPICRDPGATKIIIPAVRSGRVARNNLKQFLRDHPGQLGPQGLYDTLTSATATIRGVLAQYH